MPAQEFDTILPEGFDGTFRFTNATQEDFVGRWGGKEYLYPAMKTTPMVILDATPLEIQNIRKKFARELAEREFFKSKKYEEFRKQEGSLGARPLNSIFMAGQYSEGELASFIQQCLEPLPMTPLSEVKATETPKIHLEDHLKTDDDGQIITQAIDKKTSLRKKALESATMK
jgi:hypothetical protein